MWLSLLVACIPELTTPGGDDSAQSGDYSPPANAWPTAASVPAIEGEGFDEGEVVEHVMAPDQNGAMVDLWQFYGNVWVLDVSTIWCQPCQDLAKGLQEIADDHKDRGFVYLTVLAEDLDGEVPEQSELQGWAESWDIVDQPIVADTSGFTSGIVRNGTFPAVLIVDRELRVVARLDVPSDEAIVEAIEEVL